MRRITLILCALLGALVLVPSHAPAQDCPECDEYDLNIPDPTGGGHEGGGESSGSDDTSPEDTTETAEPVPAPESVAPVAPVPAEATADDDAGSKADGAPKKDFGPEREGFRPAPNPSPPLSEPLEFEQAGAGGTLIDQVGGSGGLFLLTALLSVGIGGLWARRRAGSE